MSRYEIRTKLLKALAACAGRSINRRIEGVLFRNGEIIASDGHVLVKVPTDHKLTLMVPIELVDAACAASLALSDEQIDEFGYPVDNQNSVFIDVDGEHVTIDIGGGVALRAPAMPAHEFPNIDECTAKSLTGGNPMGVAFDPRKLALVTDILDAQGLNTGVWPEACGGRRDAIVFRSESGVRFVLMPMRREEAKEAA